MNTFSQQKQSKGHMWRRKVLRQVRANSLPHFLVQYFTCPDLCPQPHASFVFLSFVFQNSCGYILCEDVQTSRCFYSVLLKLLFNSFLHSPGFSIILRTHQVFSGFDKSITLLASEHMERESGPVFVSVVLKSNYLDSDSQDATF